MNNAIRERVMTSLYTAIDEFNSLQPPDRQLAKHPETLLLGSNGHLDSLGLVSFLVTVEQQIATDFKAPVTIANDKAFSLRNSPFASVTALADYIATLVEEVNV